MADKPTVDPKWATNQLPTEVIEPVQSFKDSGIAAGSTVARRNFNWMFNAISQWIDWIRSYAMDRTLNLSDLENKATSRTNLGLDSGGVTLGANAATANKLKTARSIGGVTFDGSANINLPGVNTSGNQNTSGNAATATKLSTARNIALSGDLSGSANFDGSNNISITASVTDNSHTHSSSTITSLNSEVVGKAFGSSYTTLFSGRKENGTVSLSENAGNFRWLFIGVSPDHGNYIETVLVPRFNFDGNASDDNDFAVSTGSNDFWVFNCTTGSSLSTSDENGIIYYVYGIGRI